nr:uncharacterized protein LOC128692545 [Cherax quadricarinatus]
MSEVQELEYVVLTLEDHDDVVHFLVNYFYPRNNVVIASRCSSEAALSADLKHIEVCLTSGLSTGARDKTTKTLVAIVLACDYEHCVEVPQKPENEDEIFRARNIIRNLTDEVVDTKKDRILYCTRICVHPDYGRQGVSTKILELCLDAGIKQGFTLACAISGNPFSETTCLRLGFQNTRTLDVNTLEKGLFDLSRMNYKIFKFFTKHLGPETILSSKL